ncbi:MAG TPA: AlkA N-terminal domain-containing protein [Thermoanaerobaculia bacterium]|nr:AlkA N-terminal domain-containing protein [Thermoanaerobaculia bacterium]
MIAIEVRQPFRWDALVRFLSARAIDAVESWVDGEYRRGDVRVRHESGVVHVTNEPQRARRMFDLDANPAEIEKHLAKDPLLKKIMKPGTRVPGAWDPFEVAIRAIVGQQISVAGATTIMNRLAPHLTPEEVANADLPGMPRARGDAIRGLARAVADDPTLLLPAATLDESIERLTALKGIGPWTAHYIAMRAIHHPDAFPSSDLGLVKAAAKLRIRNLEKRAERWRPYRAYAAMLLWESL